jgi:hypothetical protein
LTPRVLLRKKRDIDESMKESTERIPYIAGLLDGEGGFSIIRTTRKSLNFRARISLHMKNEETVKLYAELCGVTYNTKSSKRGAPSYYALINTEDDLQKVLEMLDPWLITKKRHSKLIQQFLSLKRELRASGASARKSTLSKMIAIYIELRKLNPKGPRVDYDELQEKLQRKVIES